jgi:uncharacterized protein (DUF169 family)
MPFKSDKISYGLPRDPYDPERAAALVADLTTAIGLRRQPVGVRLLFTAKEYDDAAGTEPKVALSYCAMVEQASRGKTVKSRLRHHRCDGGTTALGLEPSTERIESGQEYFSYDLFSSPAAARRLRSGIRSLHREGAATYGIVLAPLAEMKLQPDVVLLIADAYQTMRLTQGWVYANGSKPAIDYGAMQALCSEVTVVPYLTGEMNISALCPSTRILARWKDDEMAVGVPFERFALTVEGVIATINTTDLKQRKEQIVARFGERGAELPVSLHDDYE